MKKLNIYLSPYAYYVRINAEVFEQIKKKGNIQKWIDNDKGQLPYEFIEFQNLDMVFDRPYPEIVRNLGLTGSKLYCHHPFEFNPSSLRDAIKPRNLLSDNANEIHFILDKEQSSTLPRYRKYFTLQGKPYISKISFYVDKSRCNLHEVINYSDNTASHNYYHLVSKLIRLDKPQNFALFALGEKAT